MGVKFNRSQTFATGGTVTSAALHNLIDGTDIFPALITDQSNLATISTADKMLIADTDDTTFAKSTTVHNLFEDALSTGTYTDAYLTGQLSYGTATGTRLVAGNSTITTATLGTTTGTAASFTSGTLTTGLIPTLTAGTTTGTAASFTSGTLTTGLIPTLTVGTSTSTAATITAGTVTTLNSTAGTITNLSTTLAGDFTISSGTGTLGTSGVTAGTYGGASAIPTLTLDAKGRVTTAGTTAFTTGKILQVVQTVKSDVFSTDSSSFVDVTNFSVAITPSSISSKVLVLLNIGHIVNNSTATTTAQVQLLRNSTQIFQGDSVSDKTPVLFNIYNGGSSFGEAYYGNLRYTSIFLDSPASTSSLTYKIQVRVNTSGTVVFNKSAYDLEVYNGRTASSIIVMEVAA